MASTRIPGPLKLVPGVGSPEEVATCLMVANALEAPIILSKGGSLSGASSGFSSSESETASWALLTPEGPISSLYAACLYIAFTNDEEKKQVTSIETETSNHWEVEDALSWAAFKFRAALRGVNKAALLKQLDFLDNSLATLGSASPFSFSVPVTFSSLPAMFVFSSVRYAHPSSTLADWPQIEKLLSSVAAHPAVSSALGVFPPPSAAYAPPVTRSGLTTGCGESVVTKKHLGPEPRQFYLTTAINYTNGPPHMGHVYEAVIADVIARFHRRFGREVFFLTGADEHGQKIANTAERSGKKPQEMCDLYVSGFQDMNKRLHISNDFYIRTTSPEHQAVCQWLWKRVQEKGDIYLDTYTGWYNEREETFVTENEARAADYKDPVSGKPLQKMEEPSYFFRMSKYQARLVDHIQKHPEFIQPEERRRNILRRLEEPLLDLSCSRTTFSWGVPVPGDEKHVMYVWFDALTNYFSACKMNDGARMRFWPADLHLIGKDIIWFHTVIWPCMLMAAELPLPKTVFGHGFVTAADGEKMSKSLGNVIDPNDILKDYDSDSFRFYLVRETRLGSDLRFDPEALAACMNADLADSLGNLVHRATSLCSKYCDGVVPDAHLPGDGRPPFPIVPTVAEVDRLMAEFQLREALEVVMETCREANKYLTDWAPWTLSDAGERQGVVRGVLEAVYVLGLLLEPFIPSAAEEIFKKLHVSGKTHALLQLSPWYDNLVPGTPVEVGEVLFRKKVSPKQTAEIPFQRCEIRVGKIAKADPHPLCAKDPAAPPLLVLHLRFAETGETKTGVVMLSEKEKAQADELIGKQVMALCNVKSATVKGVVSQVMVLAAKAKPTANEGRLLTVRDGKEVPLGSVVEVSGFPPVLRSRENLKIADMQAMNLRVGEGGQVAVQGAGLLGVTGQAGAGVVVHPDIPEGNLIFA